jgi:ParB family chromosome partitioning protein
LTVLEQAQGFQMMMDLGETTQSIAEKTGFSEKTVRKRLFVASLDAKKSLSAYERGATLDAYMKLQKITDEKKRNKVLEALGTNNFNSAYQSAINEELRDRVLPAIIKQIEAFAKPTDKQSWEIKGYGYHSRCGYEDYEKTGKLGFKIPAKWEPDEYLYHVSTRDISIYKQQENFKAEVKMSELPPEEQQERREIRRKYKALKEASETAFQLRLDFVKSFAQKAQLKAEQFEALSGFAYDCLLLGEKRGHEHYAEIAGIEKGDRRMGYQQHKEIMQKDNTPAAKVLLTALYATLRDNAENTYFCGNESSTEKRGLHKTNAKLSAIYDCICALGYQMSDDEQALRNGTHELFRKEESEAKS